MNKSTLCFVALLAAASVSHAQWNQYHGNAQRTGYTSVAAATTLSASWALNIRGPIVGSPVIGPDGTIFVGPVQEDTLHPRTVVTAVSSDGTIKWQFATKFVDTGDPTFSTPAVGSDGVLYFGAPDGGFYALNPNGTQKWKYQGLRPVIQSPAIGPDGRGYVGIDGNLCSFSPDGTVNWQVPVGDARLSGGPAIAPDGTIYEPAATVASGSSMVAVSPAGVVLWQTPLNQYFWPLAPPTVGPDGTIYVADQGIHAIRPNGTLQWYSEPSYGINGYGSIAVDASNNLYYTGYVYAWKLSGATGAIMWEYTHTNNGFSLGTSQSGILVDSNGNLFMGLGGGKRSAIDYEKQLLVLSNSGARIGSFVLPEIAGTSSFAIGLDGSMYVGCLDGNLYAFNVRLQNLNPGSFSMPRGSVVSGNLASLFNVDQNYLVLRPGLTLNAQEAPIQIVLNGTSPTGSVSDLKFNLVSHADEGGISQSIELFDWVTNSYVLLDTRAATTSDSTVEVTAANPARFVQTGTNAVRARVSYRASGPIAHWPFGVLIDRSIWRIAP